MIHSILNRNAGTVHKEQTILLRIFNIEMKKTVLHDLKELGWRPVDLPRSMTVIPPGLKPDGAIVDLPLDDDEISWLRAFDFPIIRLGLVPDALDHLYPAVVMDPAGVGRMAADHFAERGYRHVAYVAHRRWPHVQVSLEAFQQRSHERGSTCESLYLTDPGKSMIPGPIEVNRYKELESWVADQVKPVAVFTYAKVATTICMICASAGWIIPDDVAVLTFDNESLQFQADLVELSAIDLAYTTLGQTAVQLLERIVKGEPAPTQAIIISPNGVVQRHSTNALAVPDPVVAKALRYIWDNLDLQVSVDHIAKQVAVSRSTLERKFRVCLGRSVNAERHRKRLSRCTELLLSTDLTIGDIGQTIGINHMSYLHRSFLKTYGMTPRHYRITGGKMGTAGKETEVTD